MENFDFVQEYRRMMPTEQQEVVDSRLASFQKLRDEINSKARMLDACRIAYQLPVPGGSVDWFEEAMGASDNKFSIEKEKVEASRIASLLVKSAIFGGDVGAALIVVTVSFHGLRKSADTQLTEFARNSLARRAIRGEPEEPLTRRFQFEGSVAEKIAAAKQSLTGETFHAAISSLRDDLEKAIGRAFSVAFSERLLRKQLEQELNMLWWYIAGWSKLLDRPRTSIKKKMLPMVVGADLGSYVKEIPGPYGVIAIIQSVLSDDAKKSAELGELVESFQADDNHSLSIELNSGSGDLFPLHFALESSRVAGVGKWQSAFHQMTGIKPAQKLSYNECALQMYNERILANSGWN